MLPTPGPIDDHNDPGPRTNRGLAIITGLAIDNPFGNCRLVKLLPPDALVIADPDRNHWRVTVQPEGSGRP